MSDLKNMLAREKQKDKGFAEGYEEGDEQFKTGVMLRLGARVGRAHAGRTGFQA